MQSINVPLKKRDRLNSAPQVINQDIRIDQHFSKSVKLFPNNLKIEIVFLYPWAVAFDQLPLFAFLAMMLFLVNLAVPYLYEWRRGGLDWD